MDGRQQRGDPEPALDLNLLRHGNDRMPAHIPFVRVDEFNHSTKMVFTRSFQMVVAAGHKVRGYQHMERVRLLNARVLPNLRAAPDERQQPGRPALLRDLQGLRGRTGEGTY